MSIITNEDELAALVRASRSEQGFPEYVADPATIVQVAVLAAGALRQRAAEAVTADA